MLINKLVYFPLSLICVSGAAILLIASATLDSSAQHLTIQNYSVGQGLVHNKINRIVKDSRGWLWICTDEGLSQYDGHSFINYGVEQGLPHSKIYDVLETKDGEYLLGTGAGVCLFSPGAKGKYHPSLASSKSSLAKIKTLFTILPFPDNAEEYEKIRLLKQSNGKIWAATSHGIYSLQVLNGLERAVWTSLHLQGSKTQFITAIEEDSQSTLWLGTKEDGIYRYRNGGETEKINPLYKYPLNEISAMTWDHYGRLWVATDKYLLQLTIDPNNGPPKIFRALVIGEHILTGVNDLADSEDGNMWIATDLGLNRLVFSASGTILERKSYTTENGLKHNEIGAILAGRSGNLWLGTKVGLMKVNPDYCLNFGKDQGVSSIVSIVSGTQGKTWFIAFDGPGVSSSRKYSKSILESTIRWRVGIYNGEKIVWENISALNNIGATGSAGAQRALQDSKGEWWFATSKGLFRLSASRDFGLLPRLTPKRLYTHKDGLISDKVHRVFEDSRGDIWILVQDPKGGLYRWDRKSELLLDMSLTLGTAGFLDNPPYSITEDRSGTVWIGHRNNGLTRYKNGEINILQEKDGVPTGRVSELFCDREGGLWAAFQDSGIRYLENPCAESLHFKQYSQEEGGRMLITSITEALNGDIYFNSNRGINRLNRRNGFIQQLNAISDSDQIGGEIQAIHCDKNGDVWVGSNSGLVRHRPSKMLDENLPKVFITKIKTPLGLYEFSPVGELPSTIILLPSNQAQIQIDFVGLVGGHSDGVQYQYQLEGAHKTQSSWEDKRTAFLPSLKSGNYQFTVKARSATGVVSTNSATLHIAILPPLWQRWRFIISTILLVTMIALCIRKYHQHNLRKLQLVRENIAADLHDDIGSNLTQISISSEVMSQNLNGHLNGTREYAEYLGGVALKARETIDAMRDLVWAIDPKRDNIRSLTQKMRSFANEMLGPGDIELRFHGDESGIKLSPETRRAIYLIFKESIHNIVRHAKCKRVEVCLLLANAQLKITIADDGRGFTPTKESEGNGIGSLYKRAKQIGAALRVDSTPGRGTIISLEVPLKKSAYWKNFLPKQVGGLW